MMWKYKHEIDSNSIMGLEIDKNNGKKGITIERRKNNTKKERTIVR